MVWSWKNNFQEPGCKGLLWTSNECYQVFFLKSETGKSWILLSTFFNTSTNSLKISHFVNSPQHKNRKIHVRKFLFKSLLEPEKSQKKEKKSVQKYHFNQTSIISTWINFIDITIKIIDLSNLGERYFMLYLIIS